MWSGVARSRHSSSLSIEAEVPDALGPRLGYQEVEVGDSIRVGMRAMNRGGSMRWALILGAVVVLGAAQGMDPGGDATMKFSHGSRTLNIRIT